jgi:hypothetical protein
MLEIPKRSDLSAREVLRGLIRKKSDQTTRLFYCSIKSYKGITTGTAGNLSSGVVVKGDRSALELLLWIFHSSSFATGFAAFAGSSTTTTGTGLGFAVRRHHAAVPGTGTFRTEVVNGT